MDGSRNICPDECSRQAAKCGSVCGSCLAQLRSIAVIHNFTHTRVPILLTSHPISSGNMKNSNVADISSYLGTLEHSILPKYQRSKVLSPGKLWRVNSDEFKICCLEVSICFSNTCGTKFAKFEPFVPIFLWRVVWENVFCPKLTISGGFTVSKPRKMEKNAKNCFLRQPSTEIIETEPKFVENRDGRFKEHLSWRVQPWGCQVWFCSLKFLSSTTFNRRNSRFHAHSRSPFIDVTPNKQRKHEK